MLSHTIPRTTTHSGYLCRSEIASPRV